MGLGRLAEHVEAVAPALGLLGRGALQRFVDGPAEHELAAEDLHRLADRGADHRLAEAADRAAERGAPALRLVVGFLEHLAGQQQREGRGIDEGRAAVAHLLGPVGTRQLVGDQVVGGLGVGNAQQRLGQAHQRDAFVRAEVIGLQEGVEPGRLVAAHRLDQGARDRLRLALLAAAASAPDPAVRARPHSRRADRQGEARYGRSWFLKSLRSEIGVRAARSHSLGAPRKDVLAGVARTVTADHQPRARASAQRNRGRQAARARAASASPARWRCWCSITIISR